MYEISMGFRGVNLHDICFIIGYTLYLCITVYGSTVTVKYSFTHIKNKLTFSDIFYFYSSCIIPYGKLFHMLQRGSIFTEILIGE